MENITVPSGTPIIQSIVKRSKLLELICLVGLMIGYCSHLGYLPLDTESDEARRAVVTAEMMISHHYVTPTINGEVYLNKPPLYNWIVAAYFKVFGDYSMFAFRLQVIVAVFITGLVIYFFVKKYTNHAIAFFTAFAYMTNGRLLIYESLYGFIDTTFALSVYTGMMLIFYFGEKKKFYLLFISSYLMCAVAYFLKGIPAIAFQGLTLLTYFLLRRDFKRLFSPAHFAGIGIFILLLGTYYACYFSYNHFSPALLFDNLFNESAQRTFIQYGFSATLKHMGTFPFEVLYHFLPWTLFLLTCIQKDFWKMVNRNRYIQYIFWIFVVNIPVYWFSVDVYPKYLFMFVPLLYCIAFYFYDHAEPRNWQKRLIRLVMIVSCFLMAVGSLVIPFIAVVHNIEFFWLKALGLTLGFGTCAYLASQEKYTVYAFLLALVVARIGFNWFVLTQRGERFVQAKSWAADIVHTTQGKPLYILDSADTRNFDGFSFYIETGRNEILTKSAVIKPGTYYIVDSSQLKRDRFHVDIPFINLPFRNQLYLVHLDGNR